MERTEKKSLRSMIMLGPAHPFRGGLAAFNQMLIRTFQRMGISCRMFTFTTQYPSLLFPGTTQYTDDPAPEGLDITRELSSINPFTWIRTGLKVRRLRSDVLIVRYWIPVMAPAFGTVCRIARRGGVRTLALLDNVIPHEKRPFDSLLTRYFVSSIDGFIYMSEQVYQDLRLFTRTKPALFSPHPMWSNYGDPMPREEACAALGLDPSLHYTMFFGYIRDYKGLDLLLDAWGELMNQGKLENHRLIVAGEYYSGKERYAEQIARLGKQFGTKYVCVVKIGTLVDKYFMQARLLDVETAGIINTTKALVFTLDDVEDISTKVVTQLLGENRDTRTIQGAFGY